MSEPQTITQVIRNKCDKNSFLEKITLTAEEISKLEEITRGQALTTAWFEHRAFRITSSIAHSFYTARTVSSSLVGKLRGIPYPIILLWHGEK